MKLKIHSKQLIYYCHIYLLTVRDKYNNFGLRKVNLTQKPTIQIRLHKSYNTNIIETINLLEYNYRTDLL